MESTIGNQPDSRWNSSLRHVSKITWVNQGRLRSTIQISSTKLWNRVILNCGASWIWRIRFSGVPQQPSLKMERSTSTLRDWFSMTMMYPPFLERIRPGITTTTTAASMMIRKVSSAHPEILLRIVDSIRPICRRPLSSVDP